MALRDVLLLTQETATVTAVTASLSSNGQLSNSNVFRTLPDVVHRLDRGGVPAVLLDVDDLGPALLAQVEPLARKFPDTKFIALAGVIRQELLLEAMHAGVRHVLAKSSVPAELSGVLHRLCADTHGTQQGSAITILSAGGGCGATTLAVNLAAELPADDGASNLVVDLDHVYGAVGTYLGLDGEYGAFDLFRRNGHIDGQLIQSTALASGKLQALLSMTRRRLGEAVSVDPQRAGDLIDACKSAYKWSVVDAPRVSLDVAAELARRSHVTLLPLQLMIKDIQVARHTLSGLAARGVNLARVHLFATRYRKRALAISVEEARRALGLTESQSFTTLSNDFAAVTEAANLGKPLAGTAPRSDYRRDVQKLAGTLAALPQLFTAGRSAAMAHV